MTRNVGPMDRALRVLVAFGLFALFFVLDGPMRYIGLVGLVPLLTAAAGFCPLYRLIGVNTCPRRDTHA